MKNKQHYLINENFELGDHSLFRQFSHLCRMQFSIMGWYHSGPGLKNLCILFIYHYPGRYIYRLHAWYHRHPRLRARINRFIPGR